MESRKRQNTSTTSFSFTNDPHPSVWPVLGEYLFKMDRVTLWRLAVSCKFFYERFGPQFWLDHIPEHLFSAELQAQFKTPVTRNMIIADKESVMGILSSHHTHRCFQCGSNSELNRLECHPLRPFICSVCFEVGRTFHARTIDIQRARRIFKLSEEQLGLIPKMGVDRFAPYEGVTHTEECMYFVARFCKKTK